MDWVATLVGAILGCLPGMAIGGAIGLSRRKTLPCATDAGPEPDGLFLKVFVFPILGGAALWTLYLLIFNPWVYEYLSIMEKQ